MGKPLAQESRKHPISALVVANLTLVIAKIKLRQTFRPVLLRTMLIDPTHAALADTEIALNRVRVNLAATVLATIMVNDMMLAEIAAQIAILPSFMGHDARLAGDMISENGCQRPCLQVIYNHPLGAAFTVNWRQNLELMLIAAPIHQRKKGRPRTAAQGTLEECKRE